MKPASALLALAIFISAYSPRNDFSVFIRVYIQGSRPLWTYRLNADRITVTRHYTDGRRDSTVFERALTEKELRRLDRFFTGFPLGEIKRHYLNEAIDGDSCVRYTLRVNRIEKVSYVCYARPPGLAGLNRALNRLMPRRYRLWVEE